MCCQPPGTGICVAFSHLWWGDASLRKQKILSSFCVLLSSFRCWRLFHKSETFCYGAAKEMESFYTSLFGCNLGAYPFRYLGIPMHHRQLLNPKWTKVEERFQQKLSCWKAKCLSYGGRLVPLNSVLSILPMFMSFVPLNISFRRSLVDNNLRHWLNLVARVSNVVLVDGKHYFNCPLTKTVFSLSDRCILMS
jgi:hypothetical protein